MFFFIFVLNSLVLQLVIMKSFFLKRLTVFNKVTSKEYILMFLFIIGRENADLKSLLVECFSTKLDNSNLGFLRIIKIKHK